MACQAWAICVAQRQVWSMCSRVWRALWVMRAATCRTRLRKSGDFGVAEGGAVAEAEEFGPAHEVGGGEQGVQPGAVFGECSAGEVAQSGVFGFADAVFDAGVLAVVQFESGGLATDDAVGDVGDEGGDAVPSASVNRSWAPGCRHWYFVPRARRSPRGQAQAIHAYRLTHVFMVPTSFTAASAELDLAAAATAGSRVSRGIPSPRGAYQRRLGLISHAAETILAPFKKSTLPAPGIACPDAEISSSRPVATAPGVTSFRIGRVVSFKVG